MDPPSTDNSENTEITASTHSIDQINPIPKDDEQKENHMPAPPPTASTPQPPRTIPCYDLLRNTRDYQDFCAPLFQASMVGDWKSAERILQGRPDLVRFSITENGDTALHIAASATSSKLMEEFVKNLVTLMKREDLELQNNNHNTALCLAVTNGNVNVVGILLKKNERLLVIPGSGGMMPLYMASLYGKSEMVNYLYDKSHCLRDDGWTRSNRGWLLEKCVESDLFDVALKIVRDWPELAVSWGVLRVLAQKTDALNGRKRHFIWGVISQIFAAIRVKVGHAGMESDAMQLLESVWTSIAKLPKRELDDIIRGTADPVKRRITQEIDNIIRGPAGPVKRGIIQRSYFSRVLFLAAEMGNTAFVVELVRQYPELIWKVNGNNQTIFHVAVIHRHVDIYNLLYEIGSMKDMITPLKDSNGNNLLHLVGKRPKRKKLQGASSIALQLQEELLWFEEVKSVMPASFRGRKNNDGLQPHELFIQEHKELVVVIEEWMKAAANQSLVVAALIASIGFAAPFTVPGGYNQNDGIPIFLHRRSFLIFIISDGISLAFSSIAILIFLSFFTSISSDPDFVQTLTKKLTQGLAALFFSITAMLVAFIVNLFVIYQDTLIWVPIFMSILISIPVILYARLQSELLVNVFRSSYNSKYIFNRKKNVLFYKNPKF